MSTIADLSFLCLLPQSMYAAHPSGRLTTALGRGSGGVYWHLPSIHCRLPTQYLEDIQIPDVELIALVLATDLPVHNSPRIYSDVDSNQYCTACTHLPLLIMKKYWWCFVQFPLFRMYMEWYTKAVLSITSIMAIPAPQPSQVSQPSHILQPSQSLKPLEPLKYLAVKYHQCRALSTHFYCDLPTI